MFCEIQRKHNRYQHDVYAKQRHFEIHQHIHVTCCSMSPSSAVTRLTVYRRIAIRERRAWLDFFSRGYYRSFCSCSRSANMLSRFVKHVAAHMILLTECFSRHWWTDWKVTLLDDHGCIVDTTDRCWEVSRALEFVLRVLAAETANTNLT